MIASRRLYWQAGKPWASKLCPCVQIKELATFSADPNPNVTRVIFTSADLRARKYIKQLMYDASLHVR